MWCDEPITQEAIAARDAIAELARVREQGIDNRILSMRARGKTWPAIALATGLGATGARNRWLRLTAAAQESEAAGMSTSILRIYERTAIA